MPDSKHVSRLFKLLYFALGLGAAYLALRFALPWVLPFLLALLTARLLQPALRFLEKRLHLPHTLASVLCCTLALALLAGLGYLILGRILYELANAAQQLPSLLARVPDMGQGLENALYKWIIAAPEETQAYLFAAVESVLGKVSELPALLYEWVLSLLSALVNGAPGAVLSVSAFAVALFLFSGSYGQITTFLLAQIPPRHQPGAKALRQNLFSSLGCWLRTQLILMGITFLELCLGLGLLHIPYFVVTALSVALVDALPVLGTGIILAPWAVFSILSGEYVQGIVLLALWAVTALVRSAVEPRLLGSQIGLHPAATLVALYVGFQAAGVAGMILAPLLLITLKQVQDSGLIALWKEEVPRAQ